MGLVTGHKIVAIGAGSGLGRGVVRRLIEDGAKVTVLEISDEKVDAIRAEFGDSVVAIAGDASKLADLERCRAAHVEAFGQLDALICFQGIFDGNVPLTSIEPEKIDALFDELFRINVKSSILAARVFIELLQKSAGAIVLTSSNAAYAADGGGAFYSATKGAIRSLVGQLAFEFAPNVRVNAVAPGAIAKSELRGPTALGMDNFKQSDIPEDLFLESFHRLALMPELPSAEDYAETYAFLASHQNKIMTGQTILTEQGLLNRSILTSK